MSGSPSDGGQDAPATAGTLMLTCLLLGAAVGTGIGFLVGWPVSGGIIGLTFGFLVALGVVARRFRRL